MIQWSKEVDIEKGIEEVWEVFSDERIMEIMPNIVEHKLISGESRALHSEYEQVSREGKREERYIVRVVKSVNTDSKKELGYRFTLGKSFEIVVDFYLEKQGEKTKFIYSGKNEGINFLGKTMLKLMPRGANNKVVDDFTLRVKRLAEGR